MQAAAAANARHWPFAWLYPDFDFLSTDAQLLTRQKSAIFIYDLCTRLNLPYYCLYTAVTYANRFFKIHPPMTCQPQRVCQASVLLACKSEDVTCCLADICNCTNQALGATNHMISDEMFDIHRREIVTYENMLLATLGFAVNVSKPYSAIVQMISKFGAPAELTKTAFYLATESVLITPFCIKYSAELIACFCIQLALESTMSDEMNSTSLKSIESTIAIKQLHDMIDEFDAMWKLYPDRYKTKPAGIERRIARILSERVSLMSAEIDRPREPTVSAEEIGSFPLLTAIAEKFPPSDTLGEKVGSTSPIEQTGPAIPFVLDGLSANKRPCDSSDHDSQPRKRLFSSSK